MTLDLIVGISVSVVAAVVATILRRVLEILFERRKRRADSEIVISRSERDIRVTLAAKYSPRDLETQLTDIVKGSAINDHAERTRTMEDLHFKYSLLSLLSGLLIMLGGAVLAMIDLLSLTTFSFRVLGLAIELPHGTVGVLLVFVGFMVIRVSKAPTKTYE